MEENIIKVENLIYEIRGKQVMLDSDVARLYQCETKYVNRIVKRNIKRFPEEFCFQLNENEFLNLRCQFVTSSLENNYGGRRYLPYVFTEEGVAMLATILRTKIAEEVSIRIMDAFAMMRHYLNDNLLEQKYINNQVLKNTEDIKLLKELFEKFKEKRKQNEIYYNGQIFDAYSKIYELFTTTKNRLIIIDSYADNTILDIIKRLDTKVVIITKKGNLLTEQDIKKYNIQYHNLKVVFTNTFHDRYFIIDNHILYHCGASINRIGYKTFSINLISDKELKANLINKVNDIIKSNT